VITDIDVVARARRHRRRCWRSRPDRPDAEFRGQRALNDKSGYEQVMVAR
jgi:hypothetical protein